MCRPAQKSKKTWLPTFWQESILIYEFLRVFSVCQPAQKSKKTWLRKAKRPDSRRSDRNQYWSTSSCVGAPRICWWLQPNTLNTKYKSPKSTTACVYDGNNDHYYTCVRRQETNYNSNDTSALRLQQKWRRPTSLSITSKRVGKIGPRIQDLLQLLMNGIKMYYNSMGNTLNMI